MVPISSPVKCMFTAGIAVPLQEAFPKAKHGGGGGSKSFPPPSPEDAEYPQQRRKARAGAQHLGEAVRPLPRETVG